MLNLIAENVRIEFAPRDLALQPNFDFLAPIRRRLSVLGPFLDGLRCYAKDVRKRRLAASDPYCLVNSGFHVCLSSRITI